MMTPVTTLAALDLPGVPPSFWSLLRASAGPDRIALVGGAVRDWLLHHEHFDPWRGLVDLDLVIEERASAPVLRHAPQASPAWRLVESLLQVEDGLTVRAATPHGRYGTVELELELDLAAAPPSPFADPVRLLLDVASARCERYPVPAENPVVRFGTLEDDLARRDFTINAMAIDLGSGTLLDPHQGQADLAARRLRFLHPTSVEDDPTRLVRAARYAARLNFRLAPESELQAASTLAAWPWAWRPGDPPPQAPAALGTRLRRELDLLVERENWPIALTCLQEWGALVLLDPDLQADRCWRRRLHWARRFHLPLMVALVAGAADPLPVAERLQLPHRDHRLLLELQELRRRLAEPSPETACSWCQLLEAPGLSPPAVALALACGLGPRRPLLRWLLRWRHLGPECSSRDLIASGVPPGPGLGERLRRSRQQRLERERI
jgi:poly(A) polymerase